MMDILPPLEVMGDGFATDILRLKQRLDILIKLEITHIS